ncbi:MAG: cytochrome c [Bacteroidia bacterium]|nr:cytochrome c [Bacteroidia bacterium]MCX7763947.1 cytochrome c [Bacteroidia bacterium]
MRLALKLLLISAAGYTLSGCGRTDPRDPGIEYAPQMYHSIPLEPYSQMDYFPYTKDGKHVIEPVAGTVARGKADYYYPFPNTNEGYEEAGKVLKNPLPATPENIAEGKRLYEYYCIHCHGEKGNGRGTLVEAGKYPQVPSYYGPQLRDLPEGKMFHSITYGKNLMGSHASQLSPEERWKVILYVQELRAKGLAEEAQSQAAAQTNPPKTQ